MPVNKTLGREGDFAVNHPCLEKITNLDTHLLTDMPRNDNLKFILYSYDFHMFTLSSTV